MPTKPRGRHPKDRRRVARPASSAPPFAYEPVPRLWPDATLVCVGSGPSLCADDLAQCREAGARLVVINNAYQLAPWADVLYAADTQWWKWHREVSDAEMPALRYTVSRRAVAFRPSLHVIKWNGQLGLSLDPHGVRLGGHSGYQAINLAVLFGARRILMLGYDMMPAADGSHHFHAPHPFNAHLNYDVRWSNYLSLRLGCDEATITLVNCTRRTALSADYVPQASLKEALGS